MQHMTTTTFRGFNIYSSKLPTINVNAFLLWNTFFKNHKRISICLKYITTQVFAEYSCLKNCNWVKLISNSMQYSGMWIHDFWNPQWMRIHPRNSNTWSTSLPCLLSMLKKPRHLCHGTRTTVQSPRNTLLRLLTQKQGADLEAGLEDIIIIPTEVFKISLA